MIGWIARLKHLIAQIYSLDRKLERLQETLGRIEARQINSTAFQDLRSAEFQAFSQWGEDGIIQRLINEVPIVRRTFVEFGVQDYKESNTRFLLMHSNWNGLVIDGDADNIQLIRQDEIFWRYDLNAERAFITRENINDILSRNGLSGDIGLLSVDIDGNDYWVWEAIEVVSPRLVVVEYNSRFGPDRAVTVPYDPNFTRARAHPSMIYYGASLAALVSLGARKGYDFVGSNSSGNNAFFIRRDVRPATVPAKTAIEGYVQCKFREARGNDGQLLFLAFEDERRILDSLPLVEVSV